MARVRGPLSAGLLCRGVGGNTGGLVSPLPGGLLAGGRVWTRRVVFGVVEPCCLWGPGLGPFAGVHCQGVVCGWVPTAAVFVGLGTAPLPAGDARCSRIAVALWCCGWCHCAARLDARSCCGLRGAPAPDGAGTLVVRVVLAACCWCGELTDAWGVEVDGLEDVEAVGLCSAPTPDGARARTFVALVGRDRGRRVVMVAVLRQEEEELSCRAPPAIIPANTALPYVPGRGGETCGC